MNSSFGFVPLRAATPAFEIAHVAYVGGNPFGVERREHVVGREQIAAPLLRFEFADLRNEREIVRQKLGFRRQCAGEPARLE